MLIALGILLLVYVGACYGLARTYLSPPREVPPRAAGLDEVVISTHSGHTPCFLTPGLSSGHPSSVVFVMAHGYGGNRGGWELLMTDLRARGYDSIAPAMPGQDASPDKAVGFGIKEARVTVDTVHWVRTHSASKPKIVLLGVSMGGAACWLASEQDPTVDAVVTEGAYARFDEAMKHWFERKAPGSSFYLRPVIWIASWMSGGSPSSVVPVNSAAKWHGRRALVIQGEADTLIGMSHAERLAQAAGCELWRVPRAQHSHCYECATQTYVEKLVAMARRVDSQP